MEFILGAAVFLAGVLTGAIIMSASYQEKENR